MLLRLANTLPLTVGSTNSAWQNDLFWLNDSATLTVASNRTSLKLEATGERSYLP